MPSDLAAFGGRELSDTVLDGLMALAEGVPAAVVAGVAAGPGLLRVLLSKR